MLYLKRDHLTEWFNGKQNERRHGSASPFTALKTNCIDDRVYASALDSGLAPLPWASCNNCMLVRLLGSSTFWLKITPRKPLLHASACSKAIPKYTVLWQYPCPGKPTWKALQAVTRLLRTLNVLSGNSLNVRGPVWTVADGFPDVFRGQQPPSVWLWRYDPDLPTVFQTKFCKARINEWKDC